MIVPGRLAPAQRAQLAPVSQAEGWAWTLPIPVRAYARAERTTADGTRHAVAYLRLAHAVPDLPRVLAAALPEPLQWEDERADVAPPCAEPPCRGAARARLLDPRTLRIEHGMPPPAGEDSSCAALLAQHPEALEVSVRAGALPGSPLRETRTLLRQTAGGIGRTTERHYASEEAAARAMRELLHGGDELGSFGGLPITSFPQRAGPVIAQRAEVALELLALARDDADRLATARTEAGPPGAIAGLDPADTAAVQRLLEAELARPVAPDPSAARAHDQLLEALLVRARTEAPADPVLLEQQFRLRLRGLAAGGDPRGPGQLAELALARGLGEAARWRLRRREALAHYDLAALAEALARDLSLPRDVARRAARELGDALRRGAPYASAERAFVGARELTRAAEARPRDLHAVRLPVVDLVRLLALLAESAVEGDLTVSLLVPGGHAAADLGALPLTSGATAGGGTPGLFFLAEHARPAQLAALGRALALSTEDGAFRALVGFQRAGRRTAHWVAGRRSGSTLAIAALSRPLGGLRWALVTRLALAPLAQLTGAIYPPDELLVSAADPSEALVVRAAAERTPRLRCAQETTLVRCRGELDDHEAARRGLVEVARALLGPEARALWSGTAR